MVKFELQLKQDEITVNDFAEKIDLASNKSFVTKKELLQKLIGEDVVKTQTINFACQLFIQFEEELDESNHSIKC